MEGEAPAPPPPMFKFSLPVHVRRHRHAVCDSVILQTLHMAAAVLVFALATTFAKLQMPRCTGRDCVALYQAFCLLLGVVGVAAVAAVSAARSLVIVNS